MTAAVFLLLTQDCFRYTLFPDQFPHIHKEDEMPTATEAMPTPVRLRKTVRTFKKQEVQNPHHQYPTLYRTDAYAEPGETLGPTEQVVYDHKVKSAAEVIEKPGTYVLMDEIEYTQRDACLALLRRFIQVVPKEKCPICGGTGYYEKEINDLGEKTSQRCDCNDPRIGKPSAADLELIAEMERQLGIPSELPTGRASTANPWAPG